MVGRGRGKSETQGRSREICAVPASGELTFSVWTERRTCSLRVHSAAFGLFLLPQIHYRSVPAPLLPVFTRTPKTLNVQQLDTYLK